jgi:hypothetical protein
MIWNDILNDWENGIGLKYPKQLKGRFQWNTSVLKNGGKSEFKQSFRTNTKLPQKQNTKEFKEHMLKSTNKYVTYFPNLSKDTMLVIPMPVRGRNYATLRDFIDTAPEIQQQEFWKTVAHVAKDFANKHEKVWISVHGMGVDYTHVRISSSPKYYFNADLAKE